jgi:catechol 2,3-dioxygenase-like lactoylglutathione lyase family enzyme
VWLDHISYGVSDYQRSTAFYRDLMGWEIKTDNRRSQCSMKIGNVGGVIIRNNVRAAGVIDHVSWGIEPWDTERVKAELERRGPQAASGHDRRELQELSREGSRRLGSAD